jgi:O-antigen ligase
LSIPIITYFLGFNDYFLQSKEYLPVILNTVFSFILILKQKKNLYIPAFKWIAGIFILFLFSGFTNGFANQNFINRSLLLYVLTFGLFLQFFLNQKLSYYNKIKLALIFVVFAALQLLLSFLIFYYSMETPNGIIFKEFLISVFYNPSIYVNWILLLAPFLFMFVILVKSRLPKYRIIGWLCCFLLIIFFITILINRNRTGLIVFVTLIIYHLYFNVKFGKIKKLFLITSSCLLLILIFINTNKHDSNRGRLLILKITKNMVSDNPLFGIGFNNYRNQYNNYQKEFFTNSRKNDEILLANDYTFANNEWIQFITEIGFVGTAFFLFFLIKTYNVLFAKNKFNFGVNSLLYQCKNGFLIVVFLLSIFSNPFRLPEVLYLISVILLFFSLVIPSANTVDFMSPLFSKKILIIILIFLSTPLLIQQYYLVKWMTHSKKFFSGNIENFDYNNSFLTKNESYLYTTSKQLFYKGNYYGSINQLKRLKGLKNDSQSEMLYGLNYTKLEKHDKALEYFKSASLMNPKLFRPKYLIMNEYLFLGDTVSAVNQAEIMIKSPIKIPSNEIDYYINKAKIVTFYK